MQDKRRRGSDGDVLDQAVEAAIAGLLADLPPERRVEVLRLVQADLGDVLANAPSPEGGIVPDMAMRARLAAAMRISMPEQRDHDGVEAGRNSPRRED